MTPEDILAVIQKKLDSMPTDIDIPLSWSQRRFEEHLEERERWRHLGNATRSALETLAEVEPLIAALQKQAADLQTVREIHCEVLLSCSPRSRDRAEMDKAQGAKLSIYAIDGKLDVHSEALPSPFPLFTELEKLGYRGSVAEPWNPFSGLFGSLPSIERRLKALDKRRVEAQGVLDVAARRAAG
jgi:hypothetical protein